MAASPTGTGGFAGTGGEEDAPLPPVAVLDAGAHQWRCGFAGGEEIDAILDSSTAGWSAALAKLEAEPAEHAVLLSEPAGSSNADREATVKTLFDLGVQALYVSAAPLLPLYHFSMDTGVIVDVGERRTTIWPVYEGHLALGAATVLELGGWDLTRWLALRLQELGQQPAASAPAAAPAAPAAAALAAAAPAAAARAAEAAEVEATGMETTAVAGTEEAATVAVVRVAGARLAGTQLRILG